MTASLLNVAIIALTKRIFIKIQISHLFISILLIVAVDFTSPLVYSLLFQDMIMFSLFFIIFGTLFVTVSNTTFTTTFNLYLLILLLVPLLFLLVLFCKPL